MSSEETNGAVETVEVVETTETAAKEAEKLERLELADAAEVECQEAEAELVNAKEAHAAAKREYDLRVLCLRKLCRERDEQHPLFDAAIKRDDWRSLPLAELKLSAKVEKAIVDSGLLTLGALQEHMNDQGGFWAEQIKGLGSRGVEEVGNAFVQFWAAHPEYCNDDTEEAEEA